MDIGVSSIWVPQFHSGCAALFRGVLVRTHDANGFQMFALSCYDIRMCDFSLSHLKLLNCDNFDIWWHLMMSGYAVWCWKNSRTWCFDAGRGLTVLNAIGARSVGTRSTRPHTLTFRIYEFVQYTIVATNSRHRSQRTWGMSYTIHSKKFYCNSRRTKSICVLRSTGSLKNNVLPIISPLEVDDSDNGATRASKTFPEYEARNWGNKHKPPSNPIWPSLQI